MEPLSPPNPSDGEGTGGMLEIRYALLNSRRYPAMYLPYQRCRRRRRRFLVYLSSAYPDNFVAEIMRLIRESRERVVRV